MWTEWLRLIPRLGANIEFRAKLRAFEHGYHSLEKAEHDAKCRELERYVEEVLKPAGKGGEERQHDIRDDREALSNDLAKAQKDIYLYLRSLRVADAIRFPNEDMVGLRSFEEVAGKAIDSDHRTLARVGYAGEQSGPAHIDFGKDWQSGIVPFLKSAVAIISMPSVTPSCLEESYLIRNTKELLAKTLFVLPPLCCYQPLPDRLYPLEEDFVTFQHKVVAFHREVFGLHFPDPMVREGCFVMMDFETGKVVTSRPWKIVEMTLHYKSGREATHKFPSLDERDIRAAVNLVLHARGFI